MNNEIRDTFDLQLEMDTSGGPVVPKVTSGSLLVSSPGLEITLAEGPQDGHGFGLAEVVTITIAVGSGVASNLVADAIKASFEAVIRRVRGNAGEGSGSDEQLTSVIEAHRDGAESN